ncbi:MAG TPA: asparagine synthase C-terminal domain-containing protein, partial [Polyangium sp.]|nr:asparagine synthase C-terminal domain-containing protein [Polyangium sp.]
DRFDERPYIDEVVRHTGADAHYVYPSLAELFDTVDRVTWMQDEPFGSTSIYAQWHVFRLAAEHRVKVMLDGQGADEQLAGYFAILPGSLRLDAHAAISVLPERITYKANPADFIGDYRADGTMVVGGATVTASF